jgi:hypothetical protein
VNDFVLSLGYILEALRYKIVVSPAERLNTSDVPTNTSPFMRKADDEDKPVSRTLWSTELNL